MTPPERIADVFMAKRPMLLRLLCARLGSAAEAEDALQDMWIKVIQAAERPIAEPAAYLFRMASNLATDRRLAASRRVSLEQAWLELRPEAHEHADAERMLVARDRLAQVQAVLSDMPERMRMAYTLFRLEELPQRAIAVKMGISLSAVEKLLQRAYSRFHAIEEGSDERD